MHGRRGAVHSAYPPGSVSSNQPPQIPQLKLRKPPSTQAVPASRTRRFQSISTFRSARLLPASPWRLRRLPQLVWPAVGFLFTFRQPNPFHRAEPLIIFFCSSSLQLSPRAETLDDDPLPQHHSTLHVSAFSGRFLLDLTFSATRPRMLPTGSALYLRL